MILKKLANAIRKQDWFTVVIEILIVVIGIFLGLQVTEWNEARKLADAEAAYLTALARDAQAMDEDLQTLIIAQEQRLSHMRDAHAALATCTRSDEAINNLRIAFTEYQIARSIDVIDATYNEMVASGIIARMTDDRQKRAIIGAFSALRQLPNSVESVRASMPVVDAIVWKYVRLNANWETREWLADFDFDKLCDNIEIQNALYEMLDIQRDVRGFTVRSRDNIQTLRRLLPAPPESVAIS